jgi:putative DNA primase/helicase
VSTSTDELQEVRAGLAANADELALSLLGQPTSRTRDEWRWGQHGSLSMVMRGGKRGLWHDHEAGEGGDLLALIQRDRGGTFPTALDYARVYLRMPQTERPKPSPRARPAQAQDDSAAQIAWARRLWGERRPIVGTAAEVYLVEHRAITAPGAWPDALAYHPGRNALIVAATDDAGVVHAVQLVHLTVDGANTALAEWGHFSS